jgi:hypothetical protein
MSFVRSTLNVDEHTVISLRYVESITYPDKDERLIEQLKDDVIFYVRMISGQQHTVPVSLNNWRKEEPHFVRNNIFERWKYLQENGK